MNSGHIDDFVSVYYDHLPKHNPIAEYKQVAKDLVQVYDDLNHWASQQPQKLRGKKHTAIIADIKPPHTEPHQHRNDTPAQIQHKQFSGQQTGGAERFVSHMGKGKKQRTKGKTVQSAPLAKSYNLRSWAPKIHVSPRGDSTLVHHREYIQDVSGSVEFTNTQYAVQPGISTLFPWLSDFAMRYEKYRFRSLRFYLEPLKSASTNGIMMMAIDIDAVDHAPNNKQMLMNLEGAARTSVWTACVLDQRVSAFAYPWYFVRTGTIPATDLKTYDVGTLNVAAFGCADASAIAELWVEYQLELSVPQMSTDIAQPNSAKIVGVSPSKTALFGATPTITGGLNVTALNNVLTFNKVGKYQVSIVLVGTGLSTAYPPLSGTVTRSNRLGNGYLYSNSGSTDSLIDVDLSVSAAGQTLIYDLTGVGSITSTTARIGLYDTSLG